MQPAVLRAMLDGARFGSAIRAELLDPRIAVITELDQKQVGALDRHGLQPFAVSEIRPDIFEACIRLVPASEPAPSSKVQKKAAAIAARIVGGQASEIIFLPGFINPTMWIRKKRRVAAMLRNAARVVAERGAQLIASVQRQLQKIGAKLNVVQPSADLPPAGSVVDSQLTVRGRTLPSVAPLNRMGTFATVLKSGLSPCRGI